MFCFIYKLCFLSLCLKYGQTHVHHFYTLERASSSVVSRRHLEVSQGLARWRSRPPSQWGAVPDPVLPIQVDAEAQGTPEPSPDQILRRSLESWTGLYVAGSKQETSAQGPIPPRLSSMRFPNPDCPPLPNKASSCGLLAGLLR